MRKLYRPVGIKELNLILNTGCRRYPDRLPTQPIFYPVLNQAYASEIAEKWNTKDSNSGYAGYITQFYVNEEYISKYKPHHVGASKHKELWIPAELMSEFNEQIISNILINNAFYGKEYIGKIDGERNINEKNYIEQFIQMKKWMSFNPMDFSCTIQAGWKTVTLNYIAWMNYDFSSVMDDTEKSRLLHSIKDILVENKKWFFTF